MFIRELNVAEFEDFVNKHPNSTHHQTLNYALLKTDYGYEYELIGYCDKENNIYAAALVLVKLVDGYLYAYIPEGFLIDFSDAKLVNEFTKALFKYYKKENITFIKINPPITIAEIDPKNNNKNYNDNKRIVNTLKICGFNELEENKSFSSILPKFNAIVNLNEFSVDKLSKNTKNKIRKGIRKGLIFEKASVYEIEKLYPFIKNKIKKSEYYYNDYYNIFARDNAIDYFLVSINYEKYIINSQNTYARELEKNENLNKKVQLKPGTRNINKKMNSDRSLLSYKNDIALASKNLNNQNKEYIAGALIIKHKDTATILISGYDKKYSSFAPNYFLYYQILEYYRNEYKYVNLNGISGDFSKENKYHGLDQFKLGFNPKIYEYIGEFDLVINKIIYNRLQKKGLLNKEFNK